MICWTGGRAKLLVLQMDYNVKSCRYFVRRPQRNVEGEPAISKDRAGKVHVMPIHVWAGRVKFLVQYALTGKQYPV